MANPNPPPPPMETRWKKGQSGNPGGKTSDHRKAEIKAAELAAKVQLELLEALNNTLESAKNDEDKLAAIRSDVLKLLKDAQDRGYGAPKSSVDLSSTDGSMSPKDHSDAVLDALKAKHGGKDDD